MEAVNIFRGVNQVGHRLLVHVVRQRGLNQNPVQVILQIQFCHVLANRFFSRIGGERDVGGANAESFAHVDL